MSRQTETPVSKTHGSGCYLVVRVLDSNKESVRSSCDKLSLSETSQPESYDVEDQTMSQPTFVASYR